ncbi:zinc ABC transporter solute-binding protein [Halomonas sp. TBZ9]|uniref:High-affinity zinc uptake system protein ZnuA n=1 Tax=Vreelandella azerica TaxID=2732867 RepID=A0A7Y3X997_9GAMM|nr:zinc ABC transporter substrate-binding protein [Halomonas azerica]NOG31467.1 zinc ABC transporter solute-binding protein [Halomonas azerica]
MNKPFARVALPLVLGLPLTALADVPNVAVDIPPVHSLVSKVMGELGEPELFMQQGASPHGYSLRPSEAQTLDNAELVVWVSNDLTPWLTSPLASLASEAAHLELMALDETQVLNYRDRSVALMAAQDDHDHHGHEEHDHENHGHDHHGHSREGQDPHGWLDPENARLWLNAIARRLSTLDPENAETYQTNATQAKADLLGLQMALEEQFAEQPTPRFVVFHDAYQYFEQRFEVPSEGAISLGDASDPSPARIEALQQHVRENAIQCVFSEPQFNAAMVENVFADTPAVMGVIDPLGVELPLGPTLYDQLLRQLADALEQCSVQQPI